MNSIVRQHYPASKLPADLREGVDPASTVTVTVTVEELERPERVMSLDEIFSYPVFGGSRRRRSTPKFEDGETSGMTEQAASRPVYLDPDDEHGMDRLLSEIA